jgi:hypothetical protein
MSTVDWRGDERTIQEPGDGMRSGVCVKCQQIDVYLVQTERFMESRVQLTVWQGARYNVYICASCGYVEWYVRPRDLDKVREYGLRVATELEGFETSTG